jgi:hypothetical protein
LKTTAPWDGPVATAQALVSPATPTSLPATLAVTEPFSRTVAVSLAAAG